jgi:hypothetical protein
LLEDGEAYVSGEISFSIDDLLERYDGLVNLNERSAQNGADSNVKFVDI